MSAGLRVLNAITSSLRMLYFQINALLIYEHCSSAKRPWERNDIT